MEFIKIESDAKKGKLLDLGLLKISLGGILI